MYNRHRNTEYVTGHPSILLTLKLVLIEDIINENEEIQRTDNILKFSLVEPRGYSIIYIYIRILT
jgi:hypothetical protein